MHFQTQIMITAIDNNKSDSTSNEELPRSMLQSGLLPAWHSVWEQEFSLQLIYTMSSKLTDIASVFKFTPRHLGPLLIWSTQPLIVFFISNINKISCKWPLTILDKDILNQYIISLLSASLPAIWVASDHILSIHMRSPNIYDQHLPASILLYYIRLNPDILSGFKSLLYKKLWLYLNMVKHLQKHGGTLPIIYSTSDRIWVFVQQNPVVKKELIIVYLTISCYWLYTLQPPTCLILVIKNLIIRPVIHMGVFFLVFYLVKWAQL